MQPEIIRCRLSVNEQVAGSFLSYPFCPPRGTADIFCEPLCGALHLEISNESGSKEPSQAQVGQEDTGSIKEDGKYSSLNELQRRLDRLL